MTCCTVWMVAYLMISGQAPVIDERAAFFTRAECDAFLRREYRGDPRPLACRMVPQEAFTWR